jgi:hypothetical protein
MFHVLLALPGQANVTVMLGVNEAFQAISFGESFDNAFAVFPNSSGEMVRHTDIESAVGTVREDVDPAIRHGLSLSGEQGGRNLVDGRAEPGHERVSDEHATLPLPFGAEPAGGEPDRPASRRDGCGDRPRNRRRIADRQFDGQSDPLGVVLSLRLYEVQAHLSLTGHWWSGFTLLANADLWAALPAALQQIVERNAEKFALLQRRDVEAVNAAGAERLAGFGMIVNTADTESFRAKLGAFYGRWREQAGAAGWRLLEAYAGEVGG